ncbi:MAG: GTP-binding protein [Paludibacteraceae bacterium]|nr:GTP-binding protein [Paludibacteraceae bacterium]
MLSTPRIPVLLLTGYLGSGKTTLLNRILNNRKGVKFAVIVNDIGEVNIDADLIQKGGVVAQEDDSLMALQNGCICCTLKMDLVDQLANIMKMRRFDYIVIEASGICEPEPIAQTICSIPNMDEEYTRYGVPYIDCIVTVVDALRLKDEFAGGNDLLRPDLDGDDIEQLVIQQIEFCNKILVNKAAEVTPAELGRLHEVLRGLQPKAEMIDCNYGNVDFEKILHTNLFDFESVATSATWVDKLEGPLDEEDDDHEEHHHEGHHDDKLHHDHDHDDDDDDDDEECEICHEHHHGHHCHHHHDHDGGEVEEYGIGTYVYMARRPMDMSRFDHFVARRWPKSVIRAKGICYFADNRDVCYLFEQAGSQVSLNNVGQWYATMPDDQLQRLLDRNPAIRRDWDEVYGDRMQKLVFIGQHLDKEAIKKELDACLI